LIDNGHYKTHITENTKCTTACALYQSTDPVSRRVQLHLQLGFNRKRRHFVEESLGGGYTWASLGLFAHKYHNYHCHHITNLLFPSGNLNEITNWTIHNTCGLAPPTALLQFYTTQYSNLEKIMLKNKR